MSLTGCYNSSSRMFTPSRKSWSMCWTIQLMTKHGISLKCGVGLHIGDAAVGAVARGTRTALGDAVNIAFRIEALTRNLGRPILVSGDFLKDWEAGQALFDPCGSYELKGYSGATELFALK